MMVSDGDYHLPFCSDGFFSYFCNQKTINMTQKEAIIEALNRLGGKASLNDIYRFAYTLADFSGSKDWKATIRWYLQKETDSFRSTKRGWWELVSYQEDIAIRDNRIKELEEANKHLMSIPKEAEFVDKFLKEVMNEYKRKRGEADPIRNILRHMGHEEAAAVLDACIDKNEEDLVKALENLKIVVQGDYVVNKHIDNQVNGVAKGATGLSIHKEEKE
jgi:uncharacterized protein Smg (DUF494 family)